MKALQGSREALKRRPVTATAELDSASSPAGGLGLDVTPASLRDGRLIGSLQRSSSHKCVSACVFTLSNVHSAHESTLKMVSKKKRKKKKSTLM